MKDWWNETSACAEGVHSSYPPWPHGLRACDDVQLARSESGLSARWLSWLYGIGGLGAGGP